MDLVIINASPRTGGGSSLIAEAFSEGTARAGAKCTYYCLGNRDMWETTRDAVCSGENIVFVLPLYVECVPGIMMEFLESLADVIQSQPISGFRKMAFILHSGFPEACQRRCCEQYLKKLPEMLGSRFAGILSRGDTFFLSNVKQEQAVWLLDAFRDMGRQFVEHGGHFFFPEAEAFTGPEYYTPKELRYYVRLSGVFLERLAQEKGCRGTLMDFPYRL